LDKRPKCMYIKGFNVTSMEYVLLMLLSKI
jgi:hypothetical protein